LFLVWRTDVRLLYFGACGILFVLLYPFFKFRALGDAVIFVAFSILPILATTFVVTGEIDAKNLVLAIPIGLITVAILHANNWRDIHTDARARIKTFSMLIGSPASAILYVFELLFPFIWLGAAIVLHGIPVWALLSLLALPLAIKAVRTAVTRADDCAAICDLDVQTAQLQLVFGLTLSTSFLVAAWV
jgi:1,4-dihydroxy-2-naphthoate octaprenyltransferase